MSEAGRVLPRWARHLVVWGSALLVLLSLGLLVVMAAEYGGRILPTGSRTPIWEDASSDDPRVRNASSRSWFDAVTAVALVAELDEGLGDSGWCAGWSIAVYDQRRIYDGLTSDIGSNRGVDRSAQDCDEWVELEVTYVYTESTSTLEDNAALEVRSSDLRVASVFDQHPAYDIGADDLLHEDLGHNTDDIIANAIGGLPLVLAELGEVDPLTVAPVDAAEPASVAEGSEDRSPGTGGTSPATSRTIAGDETVAFADAEGEGGSDVWRANRTWLVVGLASAGIGLAVLLWAWADLPLRRGDLRSALRSSGSGGPGGRGTGGRAVNPRRALKAGLARQERD